MVNWPSYVQMFQEQYGGLLRDFTDVGGVEYNGGAVLKPTDRQYPHPAPWRAEWGMHFPDKKYFRVKECFRRLGKPAAGSGERDHFSFHYGLAHAQLDASGFPITQPRLVPPPPVADLRIDVDARLSPHIHVGSTEHIPQDRVLGFDIASADMFQFLRAVRDHRRDLNRSLLELLGIRVADADKG